MLTEKDYCDYDTCVALRELGYNQSSIAFYPCQDIIVDCVDLNGDLYEAEYDKKSLVLYSSISLKNNKINKIQAPLLYEAQKWFRKEFRILIVPRYRELMEMWDCIIYDENKINIYATSTFKQYEESLLEGIKEAVKTLKENETIHE